MFFEQVKQRGDNFSYIIAEEDSKVGVVVDPSYNANEIIRLVRRHGLKIKYILNTHHHGDHVAGNRAVASALGSQIVAHKFAITEKDIEVVDGDELSVGNIKVKVIHTPGHTPDSISLLIDSKLLTGDTLFIGECGRTDLPGGSAEEMYESLFNKLMKLDENIEVYPGHDYGSRPKSTIGVEKRTNYTLEKRSLEKFIEFMSEA